MKDRFALLGVEDAQAEFVARHLLFEGRGGGFLLSVKLLGEQGRSVGDGGVGLLATDATGLEPAHLADLALDAGHEAGAAGEDEFVDIVPRERLALERSLADLLAGFEPGFGGSFELGAAEGDAQRFAGEDERLADDGVGRFGEGDLGLGGEEAQALGGLGVVARIESVLTPKLVGHEAHDEFVEVFAADVVRALGGDGVEAFGRGAEDGGVERAAADVENEDEALAAPGVEAEKSGGGERLLDEAEHGDAGEAAGVDRGLALGVVEIGGHGNDGAGDGFAARGLGVVLQFFQDERGNGLGSVGTAGVVGEDGFVRLAHA